jgi:DNA-binding NtrC family response regulator
MTADGKSCDDLYYRLAEITIKLPALRERRSDISLIAKALLAKINALARDDPTPIE